MSKTEPLFRVISKLVNYRADDWQLLKGEAEQIKQWAPEVIRDFYDTLYATEETEAVFVSGERPKLERTLEDWIMNMISGDKGPEFWDHQWLIALLHIKRGTKNLYMLGMMNRIQQGFIERFTQNYPPQQAAQLSIAFVRLSGTISGLIAECYDAVNERSTQEGMAKVGVNPALLERIKGMQIRKMLEEIA